jgi:uncharacterized protein YjbI with pentapeptide repeats
MSDLISFVTSEAIKPLLKKLRSIQQKREAELIAISDLFGDPLELAKYYVEPYCQHQNPADYDEEDPISVVQSAVFSTINTFFNRAFVSSEGGKSTLFVLSDAGMGKTSLLMMIHLHYLSRFWPSQFSSVLLKLGPDTLDRIDALQNRGNTILLLDSLDEDPTSWGNPEARIIDLLAHTTKFRRVIITCRTQFFPKTATDPFNRPGRVEIGGYVSPMIYLSYFDERQVDRYLNKRFPANLWRRMRRRPSSLHIQAKHLLDKVHSLQFRPLLLAHIEDLLASQNVTWDDYGVYQALLEAWLLREEQKLRVQGADITQEQLMHACSVVAVAMQKAGRRTIDPAQLRELANLTFEVSYIQQFNFGGRSLLNRNSNGEFRFSHYSIQEYLLADHILHGQSEEATFDFLVTEQMLRFILDKLQSFKIVEVQAYQEVTLAGKHSFSSREICLRCGLSAVYINHFRVFDCAGRVVPSFVLSGLKFDDMDLSNKDLSFLVFRNSSFIRANLSKANLSGCDLRGAVFDDADLSMVNLSGARFRDLPPSSPDASLAVEAAQSVSFVRANLSGADFSRCDLRGTVFVGAKTSGVNLSEALYERTTFLGTSESTSGEALIEEVAQRSAEVERRE